MQKLPFTKLSELPVASETLDNDLIAYRVNDDDSESWSVGVVDLYSSNSFSLVSTWFLGGAGGHCEVVENDLDAFSDFRLIQRGYDSDKHKELADAIYSSGLLPKQQGETDDEF